MFQCAVFALRLFTYDDKIQVVVTGLVPWQAAYSHHVGKQIKSFPGSEGNTIVWGRDGSRTLLTNDLKEMYRKCLCIDHHVPQLHVECFENGAFVCHRRGDDSLQTHFMLLTRLNDRVHGRTVLRLYFTANKKRTCRQFTFGSNKKYSCVRQRICDSFYSPEEHFIKIHRDTRSREDVFDRAHEFGSYTVSRNHRHSLSALWSLNRCTARLEAAENIHKCSVKEHSSKG